MDSKFNTGTVTKTVDESTPETKKDILFSPKEQSNYEINKVKYDRIIHEKVREIKSLEYKEDFSNLQQLKNISSGLNEYYYELEENIKNYQDVKRIFEDQAQQENSTLLKVFDDNIKDIKSNFSEIRDAFYNAVQKEIDKTKDILVSNPVDEVSVSILNSQEKLLRRVQKYFPTNEGHDTRSIITDNQLLAEFAKDLFGERKPDPDSDNSIGIPRTGALYKYLMTYLQKNINSNNILELMNKLELSTKLLAYFRDINIKTQQLTAYSKTSRSYINQLLKAKANNQFAELGALAKDSIDSITLMASPDIIDRSYSLFDPQNIFKNDAIDRISIHKKEAGSRLGIFYRQLQKFTADYNIERRINTLRSEIISTEIDSQINELAYEKYDKEIEDLGILYKILIGEVDINLLSEELRSRFKKTAKLIPGSKPFANNILPYVLAYKKLEPQEEVIKANIKKLTEEQRLARELHEEFLNDFNKETDPSIKSQLQQKFTNAQKRFEELDIEINSETLKLKCDSILSIILEHFSDERFDALGYGVFSAFENSESTDQMNIFSPRSAQRLIHEKDAFNIEKRTLLENLILTRDIAEFENYVESISLESNIDQPRVHTSSGFISEEDLRKGIEKADLLDPNSRVSYINPETNELESYSVRNKIENLNLKKERDPEYAKKEYLASLKSSEKVKYIENYTRDSLPKNMSDEEKEKLLREGRKVEYSVKDKILEIDNLKKLKLKKFIDEPYQEIIRNLINNKDVSRFSPELEQRTKLIKEYFEANKSSLLDNPLIKPDKADKDKIADSEIIKYLKLKSKSGFHRLSSIEKDILIWHFLAKKREYLNNSFILRERIFKDLVKTNDLIGRQNRIQMGYKNQVEDIIQDTYRDSADLINYKIISQAEEDASNVELANGSSLLNSKKEPSKTNLEYFIDNDAESQGILNTEEGREAYNKFVKDLNKIKNLIMPANVEQKANIENPTLNKPLTKSVETEPEPKKSLFGNIAGKVKSWASWLTGK